ncbi:hypothetical protein [Archaeoglobus profundus]|uniref:Uncharacterized protein n=1 Tax=Archaeoglobus profundus (strain DSM 5631 / JCM 9629 / NBRC 100127 / Av18) TaxID=572546 RepID=D2RHA5_ARCPA|nr:hypothetical protein [Archaeoglobus profundus]ADB57680.1 hypothetical protein Arcpr_0615 [Archaeoglobus profundus DSM 5631]
MYWAKFLAVVMAIVILPIACAAEPLVVSAKVRPENPTVGDVVGIYVTILGQQDESVQVYTKLKNPTFKVVDVLTKESVPYNTIKSDTIDFKISKGQTVEITIIGDMPDAETLAVIFPNAYRIDSPSIQKELTLTPQKTTRDKSTTQSERLQLLKRYGELYAKYEKVKSAIPERLQLIIEEKFRIAKSTLEDGQLEEANAILNEIEGLLTVSEPDNSSPILAVVILALIAGTAVFVWRYYLANKLPKEEEEFAQTNFRLLR